jgi:hypothetical protein
MNYTDRTYGKPLMRGGIEYLRTVPHWIWLLDRLSCGLQWLCWKLGWSWHNPLRDECTPDFSCCAGG